MKTVLKIVKKEFLQFRRDPKMFAIILIAPIVELVLLGFAVNMDVELIKLAVWDQDKTEESREFINRFSATNYFQIIDYVDNYNDFQSLIEKGSVLVGVVIPTNFEKNLELQRENKVQIIFDGSDGNKASIASGYIGKIFANYNKAKLSEKSQQYGVLSASMKNIESRNRSWFNPELKTRIFMVPGIVALLLSIITLILTSLAIVKEKEIGTLEQIIVTPIKSWELILGKLIPFVILGFVAVFLVLFAMVQIFDIQIKGSLTFLLLSSFFYNFSTLGLGIFVSTISKTQQQAMMISIFAILLPMVYLSGFAFPIENMPTIIQGISFLIPLTYFMEIIRGIILKGNGFAELWVQLIILIIIGTLLLALSSYRFQKRIE